MKKIKTLTLILFLPLISSGLMPLTSCGTDKPLTSIIKIEVTTPPTELYYKVGYKLNLEGMVVTATYSDGKTSVVTSECTTNPDVNTPLTLSHNKVIVTHTASGKTAEFNITVSEPTITSIAVTTLPTKVSYAAGEKLDLAGMVVTATLTDGSTTTLAESDYITNPNTNTPLTKGTTEVIVTHTPTSKQCKFNISVGDPKITSIAVTTNPTKVSYTAGETLDLTGMVVTATLTDGTTPTVAATDYTTNPDTNTPLTKGTTEVTVTHTQTSKQCKFSITVGDPKITSIAVTTSPTKVNYATGETLDLTGMVVTATYSDSTTKEVTSDCTTSPSTTTKLTKGTTEVTVTHTPTSKQCKFNITVGDPKVTSIKVTTAPTKISYKYGDKLDLAGMVVTATLTDGNTRTLATSEYTTNPDTSTSLTYSHNKVTVTHPASGQTAAFNISVNTSVFQTDTWTNVIKYANQGLTTLKQAYGVSTFIGLERKVTINGKEHIVRVIGEEHDDLANGTGKAALTFELVTLLSDSGGNPMTSEWGGSYSWDYETSTLWKNLSGTDDQASWGDGTGSDKRTAWQMLPLELQSGIKTVKKTVAKTYEWKPTQYSAQLFPLSAIEIGESTEYTRQEGTIYKYWADHNTNNHRIKKDVGRGIREYWLVSPDGMASAFFVSNDGSISSDIGCLWNKISVSFAFCI